jgi:DNA polymerase III, gamma/tau subunits
MSFKQITGNDELVERLRNIAGSGHIHNGYIFEGPWTANKKLVAESFAKAILCPVQPGEGCDSCRICKMIDDGNHIDVMFIEAENAETLKAKMKAEFGEEPVVNSRKKSAVKSVRNGNIEQIQEHLSKIPIEGERNIAIIKDADTVTARAYGRFLKTLEEPPVGTVIMLLSENVKNLPQTIVSRCVKLRVLPFGIKEDMKSAVQAEKLVSQITAGEPYYSIRRTLDKVGREREAAFELLDSMEEIYRNDLSGSGTGMNREYIYRAIGIIEETRDRIARNRNVAYALKSMALRIGG